MKLYVFCMSSPLISFTEFCNPAAVRISGHTAAHFSSNKHIRYSIYSQEDFKRLLDPNDIPVCNYSSNELTGHLSKKEIIFCFSILLQKRCKFILQLVSIMSQITS